MRTRQEGATTLLVVLVLLMVMGTVTLTTLRSGIMEQQIVGNDIRAKEAQEAAEAGLEYALAWASDHPIAYSMSCSSANEVNCPTFTQIVGSTSSDSYNNTLRFVKGVNSIKVVAVSQGAADRATTATSEAFIRQVPKRLFGLGKQMPPPLVSAGCLTNTQGNPDIYLLNTANTAASSGTGGTSGCLPQDSITTATWRDSNGNRIKEASENGNATTYNRAMFPGCPSLHCAWDYYFEMDLVDAKQVAIQVGNVYTATLPCGRPDASPSIYIIKRTGLIEGGHITGNCAAEGVDNDTIGTPNYPVLLIVPSAFGCPKFSADITLHGILYYESDTACGTDGWGGLNVHGSVIHEGDANNFDALINFIEIDHGLGDALNIRFQMDIDFVTRIPGTWKDF